MGSSLHVRKWFFHQNVLVGHEVWAHNLKISVLEREGKMFFGIKPLYGSHTYSYFSSFKLYNDDPRDFTLIQ